MYNYSSINLKPCNAVSISIPVSVQISLMTKLVPSPDWFIGLDSLELCQEGSFLESFTTEVFHQPRQLFTNNQAFPLDAGTDNGFTFTSPNWETEPRGEVIYVKITPTQITRTRPVAIFWFIYKPL